VPGEGGSCGQANITQADDTYLVEIHYGLPSYRDLVDFIIQPQGFFIIKLLRVISLT